MALHYVVAAMLLLWNTVDKGGLRYGNIASSTEFIAYQK